MAVDGSVAMNAWISKLRSLPAMAGRSAPEVATAIAEELRHQIAAGRAPDGTPLQPTKEGQQPLKHAARAITVKAIGTVVLIRVDGPEARHHLGAVRGKIKRQLIPSGKIPDPVTRAIQKVVEGEFRRTMGSR